MTRTFREGVFTGIPRPILWHAIEVINEQMQEDAIIRYKGMYGFHTRLNVQKDKIHLTVKFFPYSYEFLWKISKSKDTLKIILEGKTPGRFWEGLLDMKFKLERLVETQWAAISNFAVGYVTGYLVTKSEGKVRKKHIRKAHESIHTRRYTEKKERFGKIRRIGGKIRRKKK